MHKTKKSFLLLILDGFGYRETKAYNAIANAHAPTWQKLWRDYPHMLIQGSGKYVGLPDQQMGNSEVGHLNMGAGRIVHQELTRIDQAIAQGDFFENPALMKALEEVKTRQGAVHIMGLLSPGGVHSHEDHIQALIQLLKKHHIDEAYLHAFLDGRDTPPKSAMASIEKMQTIIPIASLCGRYYAMDRDGRMERTMLAFNLLTGAKSDYHANSVKEGLNAAYARGETDEFVKPTRIVSAPIQKNDLIIFMNFRADRARQLTKLFLDQGFSHFLTLTRYADNLPTTVIFPPQSMENVLGEYLSHLGLTQLRIAETEKYAHVTFFFNGGRETPYAGESRLLIPSPKVATYDLQPEMSAFKVTDALVEALQSREYDFIVCNYANPDMVGHTGNYDATLKAIETIDQCLSRILTALKEVDGEMILTADHGNAECMYDEKTAQPHTAHTSDPVPFVYVGRPATLRYQQGCLADIAPTLLPLMGLNTPSEMTGKNLLLLHE
jgi:2,3-bisphosphoglycerate-independent phosphoglycerate mutase